MSFSNVVLIGAGGNLGPPILSALTQEFNVTVLSRNSTKSTFPSGVRVVKVGDDYPYAEVVAAFKNQDVVISTVAGAAIGLQKELIDAAIEAGVKRFIPAEWGSDSTDPEVLKLIPLFQGKNDVLKYLQSKESPNFSWTGIATGAFYDWGVRKGFLHADLENKKMLILGSGEITWPTSTLAQIALATTRALQRAEKTANKYLFIQSFRVSQLQVLASLEKATGVKWEVERRDREGFLEENQKLFYEGKLEGLYEMVFTHAVSGFDWETSPRYANELLGLEQQDLDAETAKVVQTYP